ncbi:MAG: hypothetical protein Q9165_005155 [Trypethelium subeluteriae]
MPTKPAPSRKLGKNGPNVPALGFGLMGMSLPHYGSLESDAERFKLLDRAVELGATFWDSSDLYGDNEELLGKWFRRTGKRNEIFLATKFGIVADKDLLKPRFDSSAKYCKEACEKSLEALGIDCIDLYYVHRVNPETPIEETMRVLVELKNEGKVKHIGLCGVTSSTLRRACKIHPVAAIQEEYSPFLLDIETNEGTHLLKTCRELGVAVVCYSPLGRGLLTSTFQDGAFGSDPGDMRAKVFPRLMEENRDANQKLVAEFGSLAAKKGCTTSQLALAWLLKQGQDVIPIPGTKKMKWLEQNWAALDLVLSDEEEAEIRKFVESAGVVGDRTPPQFKEAGGLVDTKEEGS